MSENRDKKQGVNLAEVAEAAGVSKMTASRVLRNTGGYSDATRERVLKEAARLAYVPNRLAAAFGSDASTTLIGVLVPRITGGLFGEVVEGIDRSLSRFGYQTMIGAYEHAPEFEETWLRALLSWRPAGVILTGRAHTTATLDMLKSASIPVVEMWELNTRPLDVSVGVNHFDCGYEMGRLFMSSNRQRIGYVGTSGATGDTATARKAGFSKAVTDGGGIQPKEEVLSDKPGYYAGYYGTETLLNRYSDLDAIYYQDDAMAVGGLFYCQSKNLRVPEDIGIAGWGGMDIASILPQRLTTTALSTGGLGRTAAEALVARIRNEPVKDVIEAPTQLVPGATI